mmetsp:Transcript_8706/g.16588  ORF Transcript_8706/g.16588 Transcript_8706/m.16588 type:complete len:680 (-) Transcript_8706:195-2234(-)
MQKTMISSKQTEGAGPVSAIVLQLNMNDVLMGRGAPAIDNEGNMRFRRIVSARRAEYFAAAKRLDKDQIARQVVSTVRSRGGRFLKKIDGLEEARAQRIQAGENAWIIVDEDTVLTKVKQALRDRNADYEENRPRRRKRVRNGNLVPDSDDEDEYEDEDSSEDQKMESKEETADTNPSLGHLLLPIATGATGVAGNISNSHLPYQSAVEMNREGQLDALLRQIGQSTGYTGLSISSVLDAPPRAPTLTATNLARSSLPSGALYRNIAAGQYSLSRTGLPDLLSFRAPGHLPIDPLLGSVSNVPRALTGHDPTLRATHTRYMSGLSRSALPQQDPSVPPHVGRACTEIVFEAFTKHKPSQSHIAGASVLSTSLFETSLIFFLCDYGLPLLPSSQREGDDSTSSGSWSWGALAEKVQTESNIASYKAIANLAMVEQECVDRTSVLTRSLKSNPEEFARYTVMLLAKVEQIGGAPLSRFPSAQSEDMSLRESQDSTTKPKAGLLLNEWASRLHIATEGGQPVAFHSEDLRVAGVGDKAFSYVTSYDAHECHRMLSVIGAMTRLRHVLARRTEEQILGALSFHHDRYKAFNPSSVWWVDADGPRRDLWLIKSSLEKGIISVVDTDISSRIGAPVRTLRQSLVTIADVESRLESFSSFLHSHFESMDSVRIKEDRIRTWQALVR